MDARKYDRIADLLAQIRAHYSNIPQHQRGVYQHDVEHMVELMQQALYLNDKLGKACEKGLI